jgi:hypothetical protein
MFVRRKKVKGNIYYQLVRNSREAGKHKQKVLCHLGRHRSLEAAIAAERELAEQHQGKAAGWSNEAKFLKEDLIAEYGQEIGNIVPSRQQAYFRWRAFRKGLQTEILAAIRPVVLFMAAGRAGRQGSHRGGIRPTL